MNIGYIIKDDEKIKYLKDNFNNYNLSGHNITTLNNIEIFLNNSIKSLSTNKFVILDFDLFNKSVVETISKIRSFQRLYDCKFIVLSDDYNKEEIQEFKLNDFYNLAMVKNNTLMQDILDGKVDENYEYIKSDEADLEEELFIIKENMVNVSVSCISKDLEYTSFLTSLNIANILSLFDVNVYCIQQENKDYLSNLCDNNIITQEEDYYVNKDSDKITYCTDIPYKASIEEDSAFFIHNVGYIGDINDSVNSDVKILVSDSNISNIEKISQIDIADDTHILIVNALLEQKEYINSLKIKNLHYINAIHSFNSTNNFTTIKNIFKDKYIEFM